MKNPPCYITGWIFLIIVNSIEIKSFAQAFSKVVTYGRAFGCSPHRVKHFILFYPRRGFPNINKTLHLTVFQSYYMN